MIKRGNRERGRGTLPLLLLRKGGIGREGGGETGVMVVLAFSVYDE